MAHVYLHRQCQISKCLLVSFNIFLVQLEEMEANEKSLEKQLLNEKEQNQEMINEWEYQNERFQTSEKMINELSNQVEQVRQCNIS